MASPLDDRLLEDQIAHLRSDDRLRERAARAAELSIQERLFLTYRLCRSAMELLDSLPAEARSRAEEYREPLGPGAEEVLARFGSLASPR